MTEEAKKLYEIASNTAVKSAVMHVRVNGRSRDIALDLLDISPSSPDEYIREKVAAFMELSPKDLEFTVVERHENGNMTVRPEAVFG